MFFWFIATSIWSVWFVFRDPKFDYRLLAIAALIPDLADGLLRAFGMTQSVMHSVVTSIAVLFAIMIATAGRRPIRQRLLAIPIGLFMHLIYDGAFTATKTFWWPLTGTSIDDKSLPSIERGLINLPLELLGFVACIVAWRYFALSVAHRRHTFLKTGSLQRAD
ncbi:MAG: hypothetical protein NT119_09235 [Actinobacteria bacterium]|nr:hypothetical protein [Actinomycetota bacterium]